MGSHESLAMEIIYYMSTSTKDVVAVRHNWA